MRLIKTLGIICLFIIGANAQNGYSITGTVTDQRGPVDRAIVTMSVNGDSKVEYRTETNTVGFFGFRAVPGRYSLKVDERGGGSSVTVSVEIRPGVNESISIKLDDVQTIRESVTISADAAQPLDEVSKSVDIITGQVMRDRADFSFVESLRTIPGFRVQQLGGFGRTASIKSRGLRNQDTAVLIDGIRLRDASSISGDATSFLSDLTLTSVSRVEVLRGSGSSLYGTNAIGGTIDLKTPLPKPGMQGQVSYAAGGYGLGRFRGNISDGTTNGKFGFNLAVARTAYTKGIDGQDNAHNTNFQSRIEINPTNSTNFSARFFVSDAFVRLNTNPDTTGIPPASNSVVIEARPGVNFIVDQNDPDNFQQSKFFNGQVVLTHAINDELIFQGHYSGLKTDRNNENGVLGPGFQSSSTSFFDGRIQTANGHFDWSPKNNRITIGYEFEHEMFGNDGHTPDGFGNFFTRGYQSSNAVYAQDLLDFMDNRLQIAGGFRAQFFSLGAPEFSLSNAPYSNLAIDSPPAAYTFDGSAAYFLRSSGTKFRTHIGNGYRVPSLYERFGTFFSSFGTPEFVALGDPGLKPERTIGFDAGIEQSILGGKAKFSAVYFYNKLIDTIAYGNVVPDIGNTHRPFGGYVNSKGGIARGGEFSGEAGLTDSTDIFASYTYTNSDQREPQVFGSGIIDSLGIPNHQVTIVATQRISRFWINFDMLFTSSYLAPVFSGSTFNTYVFRFKGNRRADLTSGYTFPLKDEKFSLRLFGTIEDLFDDNYYENGFQTIGRSGRVGLSFGF
ncbi:MAG: TonB-dependent receptor [Pyrinomonadaceae bacterium]